MKKERSLLSVKEIVLLTVLIACIAFMTTKFTRANLEVSGGEYTAQISTGQIAVALYENDRLVSQSGGENEASTQGKILDDLLETDEKTIAPGKKYDEHLSVKNVGNMDEYVRVILVKRWVDESGVPMTQLDPNLIQLNLLAGENFDWIIDESSSTRERTVLYYKKALTVKESATFADSLIISDKILHLTKTEQKDGVITVTYDYDGASFELEIEVDGVQTNNGKDAILSAWGISVELDENGELSLIAGGSEDENVE